MNVMKSQQNFPPQKVAANVSISLTSAPPILLVSPTTQLPPQNIILPSQHLLWPKWFQMAMFYDLGTKTGTVRGKKCGTLHDFACHPCAGANFSIRAISGFLKIVVTRSSVKQKRPNIGNWCIQGDMAVDIWIVQKTGIRSTRRPTDRPHLRPTPPTEEMSERWKLYKNVSTIRPGQKMWNASRFCVSSLRRGQF